MIVKWQNLDEIRQKHKNETIVFAGGTFDLVHQGHIDVFKNLSEMGDIVVIAVSTNKRVRQRKGPKRPIMSQGERVKLVDSAQWVDYSLIAPQPSKNRPVPTMRIMEKLRPDIFVSVDKRWEEYREEVEELGVELKIVPRIKVNSTTRVINKILRRYKN